jgi:hypothetical protein
MRGHDGEQRGNILYFGDDEVLEIEQARMGDLVLGARPLA